MGHISHRYRLITDVFTPTTILFGMFLSWSGQRLRIKSELWVELDIQVFKGTGRRDNSVLDLNEFGKDCISSTEKHDKLGFVRINIKPPSREILFWIDLEVMW